MPGASRSPPAKAGRTRRLRARALASRERRIRAGTRVVDTPSGLDNPIWSALRDLHRTIARTADGMARYPAGFAPFLGVADPGADPAGLAALVEPGEAVLLLGVPPRAVPPARRGGRRQVCAPPSTRISVPVM